MVRTAPAAEGLRRRTLLHRRRRPIQQAASGACADRGRVIHKACPVLRVRAPNTPLKRAGFIGHTLTMDTLDPVAPTPAPAGRRRRPPRFSQAEIARAFRAAQQVGREYGVRVEPDGSISTCLLAPSPPHDMKVAHVRDFSL